MDSENLSGNKSELKLIYINVNKRYYILHMQITLRPKHIIFYLHTWLITNHGSIFLFADLEIINFYFKEKKILNIFTLLVIRYRYCLFRE